MDTWIWFWIVTVAGAALGGFFAGLGLEETRAITHLGGTDVRK